MKLSETGEFGLIKSIRRKCMAVSKDVILGIGDDAAVLDIAKGKLIVTSDMLIEDVHFDMSYTTFRQLGHKLLAVNMSDIFAMGGRPGYFVSAIGLPRRCRTEDVKAIYSGIMALASKHGISVVGGDTCSSPERIVLCGTLIGTAKRFVTRRHAQVGDAVFVTGTVGDSGMGYYLLTNSKNRTRDNAFSRHSSHLIRKHLMPDPTPLSDYSSVHSMIDISDGLIADLNHICDESGVGVILYKDKIPLSRELREVSSGLKLDAYEFAMHGGEDYVLLFTATRDIKTDAIRIGEITDRGRYIIDENGKKKKLISKGYEHFKRVNTGYEKSKLMRNYL